MHVLIKRKLEGPSIPELGQPTSTTFDSVTVPVARPSTGPAALASYELQRSLDGTTWSTIATGPSIFGNPAAQYVDGGRAPQTTYYYRARATDVAGRVSDYCAPVSGTTVGNAIPAVLNTRFAGISLVQIADYSPQGKEYRFDGVDSQTGQVFSSNSPMIWGSQWGPPRLQLINNAPANVPLDTAFQTAFTADGFQITRTIPYVGVPQCVYALRPNAPFAQQGMCYIRIKFKFPAGMNLGPGVGFGWGNVKNNYSDQKLSVGIQYAADPLWNNEPRWVLFLNQQRRSSAPAPSDIGIYNLWGASQSTPYKNTVPKQDYYYQQSASEPNQSSTYGFFGAFAPDVNGPPFDLSLWYTGEFAFRLEAPNGVVSGNAPKGWVWAATSIGTAAAPAANGTGVQRFYLDGRNMQADPNPGATQIFTVAHYDAGENYTNLPLTWRQVEIYDYWPDDASPHPADAI